MSHDVTEVTVSFINVYTHGSASVAGEVSLLFRCKVIKKTLETIVFHHIYELSLHYSWQIAAKKVLLQSETRTEMKTGKILILNASPRKRGNIAQMVAEMTDEAKAQGAEVEVIDVQKLDVKPCIACMQCRSKGCCVLPGDDAQRVLQLIKDCDAMVIAAPCYWGNIPGTLKILFDRIVYGMMDESPRGIPRPLHKGKRCVLVSTSTTPWPFNILMHQSHGAIRALKEICKYSGFKIVATIEKGGTKRNTTLTERELIKCRKAVSKVLRCPVL